MWFRSTCCAFCAYIELREKVHIVGTKPPAPEYDVIRLVQNVGRLPITSLDMTLLYWSVQLLSDGNVALIVLNLYCEHYS